MVIWMREIMPEGLTLNADWLIVKIALSKEVGGLVMLNTDPRKQRRKPDAYVGEVIETGPRCIYVKVGDRVVFQRWEFSQFDLNEEDIMIRELDLLTINDRCAPEYMAVQVYDPFRTTQVILSDEVKHSMDDSKTLFGKVISIGVQTKNEETKEIQEGDFIWFNKFDYQFRIGSGNTIVIRNDNDVVLMRGVSVKTPELAVI